MTIKAHENMDCVKEDVLENGIMQWSEVSNLAGISRMYVNPLNPELNPICYLLALLGAHHFLHVSRIRVKSLTLCD